MSQSTSSASPVAVGSEIGRLRRVIVHRPGYELEQMTPEAAGEQLYNDMLHRGVAAEEHRRVHGVLEQYAQVLELTELLREVVDDLGRREDLLRRLTERYGCPEVFSELQALSSEALSRRLIEGTPMHKDSLEKYLSPSRHALPPLPNSYFTRDPSLCVNDGVVIGAMASKVRVTEATLMQAIFRHHPEFAGVPIHYDGVDEAGEAVSVEGGDVQMVRPDLALIGYSERTSVRGIDALIQRLAQSTELRDVVVVRVPEGRATIHLDMIFTLIDHDQCLVHAPMITGTRKCTAFHVGIEDGKIGHITEHVGVLEALAARGVELVPIACGGDDPVRQAREQWASGANFVTLAPGQVLGYEHSHGTLDELDRHGYHVVSADEVIAGQRPIQRGERVAVTVRGSELARGGGGCRCMTMPVMRDPATG